MKELSPAILHWVLNIMDDYENELTDLSYIGSPSVAHDRRLLVTILVRDVWTKVLQDHDEVNGLSLDDFQIAVKKTTGYLGSPLNVEGIMKKIERDLFEAIGLEDEYSRFHQSISR